MWVIYILNPLDSKGSCNATSNNTKLVHWLLMGGLYIWYSEEGTGWGPRAPMLLLALPNVTAHPSTASVPITVLLYDGPLLCSFNVAIKGLTRWMTCVSSKLCLWVGICWPRHLTGCFLKLMTVVAFCVINTYANYDDVLVATCLVSSPFVRYMICDLMIWSVTCWPQNGVMTYSLCNYVQVLSIYVYNILPCLKTIWSSFS